MKSIKELITESDNGSKFLKDWRDTMTELSDNGINIAHQVGFPYKCRIIDTINHDHLEILANNKNEEYIIVTEYRDNQISYKNIEDFRYNVIKHLKDKGII